MSDTKQAPPIYYVLFHTPGPNWQVGTPYQKQPGVMDYVNYMATFMGDKTLVLGGPFLDNSGGMMVCKAANMEEAQKIGSEDPAVKAGLLNVEVKAWMVPMATVS
ncbi:MAG: YciI family protein [Calditrichota bacterium]